MIVVDTSVALKWVVEEPGSPEALDLIPRVLVAPDLIQAEVGGGLTKKVRLRQLSPDQARKGFDEAMALVSLLPSTLYAARALELSHELHHSIYDCYFAAAAEAHGVFMVTADRTFVTKLRASRLAPIPILLGEEVPDV